MGPRRGRSRLQHRFGRIRQQVHPMIAGRCSRHVATRGKDRLCGDGMESGMVVITHRPLPVLTLWNRLAALWTEAMTADRRAWLVGAVRPSLKEFGARTPGALTAGETQQEATAGCEDSGQFRNPPIHCIFPVMRKGTGFGPSLLGESAGDRRNLRNNRQSRPILPIVPVTISLPTGSAAGWEWSPFGRSKVFPNFTEWSWARRAF